MLMDASEYTAFKETLDECEKLAKEFNITLTDVLQIRQLLRLQWFTQMPSVK
ncbi:MAG: hypothetical protein STSR0002_23320 [Smithella sp.]|jgi:adenylate cyclase class IV